MIIPYQNRVEMNGHPIDPQSTLIYWGGFNGGDEGQPISIWAFPFWAWQFTGYPVNGDVAQGIVPVMGDRTFTLLGTNDFLCWGPIFTIKANPAGMESQLGDPLRIGYPDGQFLAVKPVIGGSINPAGVDCGVLLFSGKQFGPRI